MRHRQKREQRKKDKADWAEKKRQKTLAARFPLVLVRVEARPRECGECQACCVVVGVEEINKPTQTPCQHQCGTGCSIYAERPASCRTYYCLWQAGILRQEEYRPDKLGLIFDFRASLGGQNIFSAWEVWPGASDSQAAKDLLLKITRHFVVGVRRYKSFKATLMGPENQVRKVKQVEEARHRPENQKGGGS